MRLITIAILSLLIFACGRNPNKSAQKNESIKQEYLQKGSEMVNLTQSELLRNVSQAIKKGGPGYAVDFCHIQAMELKDSLSRLNNCEIRRIAKKYRNPSDRPQSRSEKDQLSQYEVAHQQGESLGPEVYLFDDRIEYYQPIFLDKGTCLLCHGVPGKQIAAETLEIINARYPDDLATGFELNDFRGAWKVTFLK